MKVKYLGRVDYLSTQQAMQQFVQNSAQDTESEIWLLEHNPVYTQGTACDSVTLAPSDIPVVKSDRGGQITYHGPGQLIMYVMLNLKKSDLGVKLLVNALEQSVIDYLGRFDVIAERKEGAPGVYIDGDKISALGLRVKKGFSYHGLSLNVSMDLTPFNNIDPCGYQGMQVTQLQNVIKQEETIDLKQVSDDLVAIFKSKI